jgi:hypothetical protein
MLRGLVFRAIKKKVNNFLGDEFFFCVICPLSRLFAFSIGLKDTGFSTGLKKYCLFLSEKYFALKKTGVSYLGIS